MPLRAESVGFAYAGGEPVLGSVDLEIADGERVALIGQNGAGKTTLSKLLNNILTPTSGRVLVDGVDTAGVSTSQIAKSVGYVFQNPNDQIFNSEVAAEVAYVLRAWNLSADEVEERVAAALALTELHNMRDMHPYDMPIPRRRFLTIAATLATRPRFVIIDEPTAGQDESGRALLGRIMDALRSEGVGVIVVSHDMEFVATHFPRVLVMAQGAVIADGTTRSVFADRASLQEARVQPPEPTLLAAPLPGKPVMLSAEELARAVDAVRRGQDVTS